MLRHFVFDMDGVLYRGDSILPGVKETLERIRSGGGHIAFLSNIGGAHRSQLVEKLARLGIPGSIEEVVTSGWLSVCYVKQRDPDATVLTVCDPGLAQEFTDAGVRVTDDPWEADYVVVGLDRNLTYDRLRRAHYALCNGAEFIATNRDSTYPDSLTTTMPGGGSVVAALEVSSGISPVTMGKPETTGMRMLAGSWGCGPKDIVAVGDRLDTDVATAKAFGSMAVLVLTGVTTREEAERAPEDLRPDVIIESLSELLEVVGFVPEPMAEGSA